eukprot:6175605-Prymnesium_polylepis.1
MLEQPDVFATAWNWVDAYMRIEHEEPLYRMLRQLLIARRTLLLLDGLDEGGLHREQIERHVTEVLAPQGHVMIITSRPAGLQKTRFAGFQQLSLSPLSFDQQKTAVQQRLGVELSEALMPYLESVPRDADTGQRITANPLMLSM